MLFRTQFNQAQLSQSSLNKSRLKAHRLRNTFHTILLFSLMTGILIVLGYTVVGVEGIIWAILFSLILLILTPQVPPTLMMKMYRAHALNHREAKGLYQIIDELTVRAGLLRSPRLFYIPSHTLNAFTAGSREKPLIAVTDGLLKVLTTRELTGVLAHEISHIYQNDIWVMGFADIINRMVSIFALIGIGLIAISLPLYLLELASISWSTILVLVFSPLIVSLLQLTLSRTRELSADIEAARLTGDPQALISALCRIESYRHSIWAHIFLPGKKDEQPSLLRSHPMLEERIQRLQSLKVEPAFDYARFLSYRSPPQYRAFIRRPRWHIGGMWY